MKSRPFIAESSFARAELPKVLRGLRHGISIQTDRDPPRWRAANLDIHEDLLRNSVRVMHSTRSCCHASRTTTHESHTATQRACDRGWGTHVAQSSCCHHPNRHETKSSKRQSAMTYSKSSKRQRAMTYSKSSKRQRKKKTDLWRLGRRRMR